MRVAYFDMFSGVSGDMALGACLDAGADLEGLRGAIAGLALPDVAIGTERVQRNGIEALRCVVDVPDEAEHRSLSEIVKRIDGAGFSAGVTQQAVAVFERLGRAEAVVHGVPIEEIHFHEVGALDAIVDIVGTVWCLDALDVDSVYASPFVLGTGWIESAHGRLPVPPPAVLELVRGWPVRTSQVATELTTPTGAALVSTLAAPGPAGDLVPDAIGYGAGTKELEEQPNLLRLVVGRIDEERSGMAVVECDLDDLDPRVYGPLAEHLYAAGAVEVHWVAVQMKKQRPGVTARVLCPVSRVEATGDVLLRETTTLGVRSWPVTRRTLERSVVSVTTSLGEVPAKRVVRRDGRVELRPEFEACLAIARGQGIPVRDVLQALAAELREVEPGPDEAV